MPNAWFIWICSHCKYSRGILKHWRIFTRFMLSMGTLNCSITRNNSEPSPPDTSTKQSITLKESLRIRAECSGPSILLMIPLSWTSSPDLASPVQSASTKITSTVLSTTIKPSTAFLSTQPTRAALSLKCTNTTTEQTHSRSDITAFTEGFLSVTMPLNVVWRKCILGTRAGKMKILLNPAEFLIARAGHISRLGWQN